MELFVWNRDWLWVGRDIKEILKFYENELRLWFQCCFLIPRKYPRKNLFQHRVGGGVFAPIRLRQPFLKLVLLMCATISDWESFNYCVYRVHAYLSNGRHHTICLVFLERTWDLAQSLSIFLENQVESAVFLGASLSNSHLSAGMKQSYLNLQICSIIYFLKCHFNPHAYLCFANRLVGKPHVNKAG